ncbi:uncharacterized protein LOC114842928 [Betta splendens]|uniref:Uncharacterized protein LOC114842928 n=1 Tax=Betta splendens TaxID=158456 RepID=A0A6P7KQK8_BETSP|nr:uncharacterized protein LOC114842928 [Betta splendens]
MLCPAAVSAAAAALWLLAALGPGLSHAAEENSDPGFSLCSRCFYRQEPPQGASAEPPLRPLCHRLPGGQTFATLSKPTCDTVAYSAFRLSHGSTEGDGVEEEELMHDTEVAVPALLTGGRPASHPTSPTNFPLQQWDSAVTTLVLSSVSPQCLALGGDLYILTGAGGFDGECQTEPLWSALCCSVPEGRGGFSVGLIREAGKEQRQVSVKELQELLGVQGLFSEGCGRTDEIVAGVVEHHSEEKKDDGNVSGAALGDKDVDSSVATGGEGEAGEIRQGTSAGAVKSGRSGGEQGDETHSAVVGSDPPESSADYERVDDDETDTNSSSILLCVLSTTFSILTAPLRPVVSTVTQLPGQVTYVLQEDLGVLCALPGDTVSIFHLLASDLLSWMGSAADLVLCVGETIVSSSYFCTSSMLEALTTSLYTGVTGIGTLAGDIVGIFSDALDNLWWVSKFFGGRLWEQSEDYVETVVSEMGVQASTAGKGLGKLVSRSGNGVGKVFRLGEGLVTGMVNMVIGGVKEAFGNDSE